MISNFQNEEKKKSNFQKFQLVIKLEIRKSIAHMKKGHICLC